MPEWYLLPFYAMLRSVPQKLIGVLVLFGALVHAGLHPLARHLEGALLPLPPDDEAVLLAVRGRLRRARLFRLAERRTPRRAVRRALPLVWVARLGTLYYFGFFWVLMPLVGLIETPKPLARHHRQVRAGARRSRCRVRHIMRFALPLGLRSRRRLCRARARRRTIDTDALPVKDVHWSFDGPFGTYDQAALQRGFQVYKEVCSACHSLNRVAFHTLRRAGRARLHRSRRSRRSRPATRSRPVPTTRARPPTPTASR